VLTKSEPLDAHEVAFIRTHTLIGQRIRDASPALDEVGKIVPATHERRDGTGCPEGLAGAEIPLPAGIIAICDSSCAMIDQSDYGEFRIREEALAELRRLAGSQFEPALVEVFCALERATR
jgi:response regulator RpfG family c-di-GMP phosphodiesterase